MGFFCSAHKLLVLCMYISIQCCHALGCFSICSAHRLVILPVCSVSKKLIVGITNHKLWATPTWSSHFIDSKLQFVPRPLPPLVFDCVHYPNTYREGRPENETTVAVPVLPGVAVVWGSSFNLFPVDGRGSSGGVRILLGGRWRGVCRVTVNCMSPPATPACSTAALPPGHSGINIYLVGGLLQPFASKSVLAHSVVELT